MQTRMFFKCLSKSPFGAYSITIRFYMKNSAIIQELKNLPDLTGFPTVTTPWSVMTPGCQNWPMMAASCRNLTESLSEAFSLSFFTATNMDSFSHIHSPLQMVAKCPEPIFSSILLEISDSYCVSIILIESHLT